ncbi:MAG: hypothetical protein HY075_02640 [Deltaproteobacteria bacterium]|nr:hypothetical protein [Deltaproteobacteria bacterium]
MTKHLWILCWLLLCPLRSAHAGGAGLALVYAGPGVCKDGCAEAAAVVPHRAGFRIRYVTPADVRPEVLREAAVWVQPGGDAIEVARTLSDQQKQWLRTFVEKGGGYLGFCAGAFLADSFVDDASQVRGLGLIPGTSHDYKTPGKAEVLPVDWHGTKRWLYFEEGGWFELAKESAARVLGRYATGEPAAIATRFGAGGVVIAGPHPEATPEWLEEHGLTDPDGSDLDLADEMFALATPRL